MPRLQFYVTEQISPNIAETPEGFLICADVPIARTGSQDYNIAESDIMPWLKDFEPGPNGSIIIERTPEEVFRPETIASFEGKSLTIDHPDGFVVPDNWNDLEKGTLQNVRRGDGIQSDLLLADFIIKSPDAIEFVKSGELRQLSCGYDAEYTQTAPGRGKQINIIGNHVALVQHGRAGVRCMIMDSNKYKEVLDMTWKDKLLAFKTRKTTRTVDEMSEEEAKKKLEEEEKGKTGDGDEGKEGEELSAMEKIMAILGPLVEEHKAMKETMDCWAKDKATKDAEAEEEEKKKKEEEEKGKTGDAAFKDTVSRAAILLPDFKVPDKGNVLNIRREILSSALTKDSVKEAVSPFLGGKTVDALSEDAVNAAFIGASEIMAARNNQRNSQGELGKKIGTVDSSAIAAINQKANDHWQKVKR